MAETLPAVIEAREQQELAQQAGDQALANQWYQHEMAVAAGVPVEQTTETLPAVIGFGHIPEPLSDAETSHSWAVMEQADVIAADALAARWGSSAGHNLALAQWYAWENEALMQRFVDAGLAHHPVVVETAYELAMKERLKLATPATTAPAARPEPAVVQTQGTHDDVMAQFEAEIAAAQAQGRTRQANQIYQRQLAWLQQQGFNQPVIGRGGRNA